MRGERLQRPGTSYFFQPTFSANGTNAAKSTTVTFTRAGTYPFEVAITDPGGLTVRSSVMLTVQQTLVALQVTPPYANVLSGATQQFNPQGTDQFGQFIFAGPYTWAVSGGGSISGSGLFTASALAGGPHTVTLTGAGSRTGSAMVTVTSATAPMITMPARVSPSPVTGKTAQLDVGATDDQGEPALSYAWSMTAGPAAVTFSDNGTNTAKSTTATFSKAGTYPLLVSVVDQTGNMASSVVSAEVAQTATVVQVAPGSAAVAPGATLTFAATVEDQFGDSLAPQPAIAWTVSGGGAIDALGVFTAGPAPGGPHAVTATAGAAIGTTTVTVTMAPDRLAPRVSITSPVNDSRQDAALDVTVEATDEQGVALVGLSLDGVELLPQTAAPFSWHLDAASPGVHLLGAYAVDAAGNRADAAPVRFRVGDLPDAPPAVALLGISAGMTLSGAVTLEVTAFDDVGVMSLELLVDGAVTQQTVAAGPWRPVLDGAALPPGAHTVQARAIDTAGQPGSSGTIAFRVGGVSEGPPERITGVCGCSEGGAGPLALLVVFFARAARRKR